MKVVLQALILAVLFPASVVYAKCWSMSEFPPTYCVDFQVAEVVSPDECVVQGKVLRFSIPRAESQNIKWAEELKGPGNLTTKIEVKKCGNTKVGDRLKGLLRAACNDKGESKYRYLFYGDMAVGSEGGLDISVRCGSEP